ncbi:MAG: RNA ligase (ATP) [Betaproteobacteria bacterium]|nr:RNA ligase (ATP) [Betaproteobacteria bacterium]
MQWKLRNLETSEDRIFNIGEDAAEFLGIVKHEPSLPSHMRGKIVGVDLDATAQYNFDNLKKTPKLFDDGEDVVITEKIHGTFMQIGVVPSRMANEKYFAGRVIVSSKGMGARGFVLDHNDDTNLYAQAAKKHGLLEAMLDTFGDAADRQNAPIFIFGEVFGRTNSGAGVQDLTYADEVLDFRAFDIAVGNRGAERYLDFDHFAAYCDKIKVPHVPVLYRGPYSKATVLEHTDGNTTLSDKKQIREGVVVKSAVESRHSLFGRKIAKSISEAYLLRKGNATEFN